MHSSSLLAFLEGFGTSLSLTTALGAQNTFILQQAILKSHVFKLAAICCIIDGILIILGVSGMGELISQAPKLINIIKYCGAVFLFLYGLNCIRLAFRNENRFINSVEPNSQNLRKVIINLLAVSLLNPHTYVDVLVLIGGVGTTFMGYERLMFTVGAILASIVWFFSLSYFGRYLKPLLEHSYIRKIFDIIIGLIMWTIAFSLIR